MGLRPVGFEELKFAEGAYPELAVRSWSNAARTVLVEGFTRQALFSHRHTTNANRTQALTRHRLPDIPIYINAFVGPAGIRRGDLFVELSLSIGRVETLRLLAGYLTDMTYLNWPPGKYEHSAEGPGLLRSIMGTDPAAGAEVLETVPTNARWHLIAVNLRFTSNGTVATRRVNLYVDDGTTGLLYIVGGATQAASITNYYRYASHFPRETAVTIFNLLTPIPEPLILGQGYRIQTVTTNLQAGDDYGAPQLLVEEWLED